MVEKKKLLTYIRIKIEYRRDTVFQMEKEIVGKGARRRQALEDAEDYTLESAQSVSLDETKNSDSQEKSPSQNLKTSSSSTKEDELDRLRERSRKEYLANRQRVKLESLKQQIISIEDAKRNGESLSKQQAVEYERKKKIYQTILESIKANKSEDVGPYSLPETYMDEGGKIDKKRKADVLRSRQVFHENLNEDDIAKKRNRYENEWEVGQMNRAIIPGSGSGEEIQVRGQKQYDFVFDESQFVNFTETATLDGDLKSDDSSQYTAKCLKISEVRQSLPVFKYKERFLELVSQNQVVIVVGETGSGKTTQLPQYLYESGYSKGKDGEKLKIGCTQPRRVAAISVASRVAEEMGVTIGDEVGYSIRFEDKSSKKTIIKYLTDGMLLREFLYDPELSSFGAVMIDEAHERTMSTEIILSLLKDIAKARKDLKIVIASATLNAKKFSDFFDGAPIFNIPGRRFPVDIYYTQSPEANYIQAALTTIFQIHTTQELPGDILVFLTGQDEIETMQESLEEATFKLGTLIKPMIICPVYANLPNELQKKIFEPTPPGSRKVILATNIAETSITIDGVSFVIDPGYVKENVFNPVTGMESLVVVPCSQASANQRAGRAGRLGPGKCFRLYTKWSFHNEIQKNPTPEILRVNLVSVVLLLLSLGITDLINFDFIDPPSPDALIKSLELLYALGALNSEGELTRCGRQMAEFPIEPFFAKCLITSTKYGVASEVISVVSMLSESSNLFYRPKDKRELADKRKETFFEDKGDHLTLLNIWEQWVDTGYSSQWCKDNFIQYKTLRRVRQIREQIERLGRAIGLNIDDVEVANRKVLIQKSIVSGFFPNIARLSRMGDSYISLKKNQPVYIHPSSSLYKLKPPPRLVLYHELVLTSKEYMRNCMIMDVSWISEVASHYYNKKELDILRNKKVISLHR